MKIMRTIEVFGDSILKGIQLNPFTKRYQVDNNIDVDMLSDRFSLNIVNRSKFGCTVAKGKAMLDRFFEKKRDCAAILMDFGGNDCDFDWKAISDDPDSSHEPNTPIKDFVGIYTNMIERILDKGIRPVVTNLPPIEPQRFFDWFCKGLDKERLVKWLDGVNTIYRFQEHYSRTVEEIARATGAMLIDLRKAFLRETRIGRFLCEDGVHPNTEGQKLITREFARFCAVAVG
jgi:lysophospholipase L1-like esterase